MDPAVLKGVVSTFWEMVRRQNDGLYGRLTPSPAPVASADDGEGSLRNEVDSVSERDEVRAKDAEVVEGDTGD